MTARNVLSELRSLYADAAKSAETPIADSSAVAEARLSAMSVEAPASPQPLTHSDTVMAKEPTAPQAEAVDPGATTEPLKHDAPSGLDTANDDEIVVSAENLQAMVNLKASQALASHKAQMDAEKERIEHEKQEAIKAAESLSHAVTEAEKRAAKAEKNAMQLGRVFEAMSHGQGVPVGSIGNGFIPDGLSPLVKSDSVPAYHADGLARDFKKLFEDSRTVMVPDRLSNRTYSTRDTAQLREFVSTTDRHALRLGMEKMMARDGLLTGGARKHDITAPVDVPHLYREFISSELRETFNPQRIFHQFVKPYSRPDAAPGQTVTIPRIHRTTAATTASAWKATYRGAVNTNRQPIESSSVIIPIEMWMMGTENVAPIAVSEFVFASSLTELLSAVNENLNHNYRDWEDMVIREIYFSSTRKLYSNDGAVVDAPGSVTAGGTFTYEFLVNLCARMAEEGVPPYTADGKYILWVSPKQLAQLKLSIQESRAPKDDVDIKALSEMLMPSMSLPNQYTLSGYSGSFAGFHIFSSNAVGVADSGTAGDIAVQTETTGAGAKLTRSALAFGGAPVGKVDAMPFEIVEDDYHRFNSERSYIWRSACGVAGIDVDPIRTPIAETEGTTSRASEQVGVYRVHTTDLPVA
jgi:hypothetical protein